MTITIYYKTITDNFTALLYVDDGTTEQYTMPAVELSPFEFGAAGDVDSVLYYKSIKISFGVFNSGFKLPNGFHVLVSKLMTNNSHCVIYKNSELYFRSSTIDKNDFDFDYEEMTVEVSLRNAIMDLKDINPRELNPELIAHEGSTGPVVCATFYDCLFKTVKLAFAELEELIIKSDIKAETDWLIEGESWHAGSEYFGDEATRLWGSKCPFTDALSLVKAIQNNLGCIGLLIGKKYYVIPRYESTDVDVVELFTKNDIANNKSTNVISLQPVGGIPAVEGLVVKIYEDYNAFNTQITNIFQATVGNTTNSDTTETIEFYSAGGDLPGTFPKRAWGLYVLIPEDVAGFGHAQWQLVSNKFYSPKLTPRKSLWQLVVDLVWSQMLSRVIYEVELNGVNYSYENHYKLDQSGVSFRARKITYDYQESITTLELVNCSFPAQEFEPVEQPQPESGTTIGNTVLGEILNYSTFTENNLQTEFEFKPGTTRLYRNGFRLKIVDDYTENENNRSINLVIPAIENENFVIDYEKL